jgi:ABC-type dipeptide/oligopeptide/nickel transport system ATPase subunit
MADRRKLLQQGTRLNRFLGRSRKTCADGSPPPTPRRDMDAPLARQPAGQRYVQEVSTVEHESLVRGALDRMEIGHRAQRMPQHLSGGQQRHAVPPDADQVL